MAICYPVYSPIPLLAKVVLLICGLALVGVAGVVLAVAEVAEAFAAAQAEVQQYYAQQCYGYHAEVVQCGELSGLPVAPAYCGHYGKVNEQGYGD